MTTCARGCRVARRHTPDCPDRDDCRGCQPRTAEHGLLCDPCHQRLRLVLVGTDADMDGEPAPGLGAVADWLAAHTPAGSRPRPEDVGVKRTKGDPPLPVDLDVIDLGDEIHDVLLSWCRMVADDAGLHGPVDTVPATTAAWLWTHHERLEAADYVADAWAELADLASRAHALVPWRRVSRHLVGLPCPYCHREALHVHGGDDGAQCHACRAFVPQARLRLWERMVADEVTRNLAALHAEAQTCPVPPSPAA